ncbi:MAG: RNA methyltransferase [Thermoanaerobaculia bacterium]|nr:RNA methyltransferase [Thermoanaerobaculia bacterium]
MPAELVVTSRTNAWFKRFRAAIELHREEIVVEGPKHVADCIASGWAPLAIAVREGTSFDSPAAARAIVLSDPLFRALSDTVRSQGVVALFPRPAASPSELLRRTGAIVVLDGIQDPGNTGTIVRLAAAFGAAGAIALDGTADPFSPKAIRASAGAALTVSIAQCSRAEFLALAASSNLPMLAAAAGGGTLPYPLPPRFALVLGNEGQGVSPEIASIATPVAVEMSGLMESLNVGAAAAILLWQIQSMTKMTERS